MERNEVEPRLLVDPHLYSKATATAALAVMAVVETWHTFVQRTPWRGFGVEMNRATYVLLPLLGLAVAGLWSGRAALKPWIAIGLLAMLAHSLVLTATLNPGWVYLICTGVAAWAVAIAHWPERWRQPEENGTLLAFPSEPEARHEERRAAPF